MRKLLIPSFCLLAVSLVCLSCGGASQGAAKTSGIPFRAFISDSVNVGTPAGVYIINAQKDTYPGGLAPIGAGNTPGMMAVTPNHVQTLVYSGTNTQSSDNQFSMITNSSETTAAHVILPGYTESFVVSPDSSTAYVAVPSAKVVGQSPGAIEIVSLLAGQFAGEVDIPSVHYVSLSNGGNRILAFTSVLATLGPPCDQTPSFLFVVTPSDVGVNPCPALPITGFDHPVQAYFSSDDSTAYVVNCGAECGGAQAGVQQLDMTTSPPTPGVAVPVPAASEALVDGSTMYLAGTPFANGVASQPCTGEQTAATTCGLLTVFDLSSMTVTIPGIVITDGYHNRIALGANGQLFIGARTCTEIIPAQPPPQGAEVRGCLSIYSTTTGAIVIPPANGDVTGIQPIATRTVVYVIQGGALGIYDTTTDALQFIQIKNLVGGFVDVKTVDF